VIISSLDITSGRAGLWNAELSRQFTILKAAGQNANLLLPPLSADPKNLAWHDITEDPNHWSNQCLSAYFGVASVRIFVVPK
jgi:hypothetical protein